MQCNRCRRKKIKTLYEYGGSSVCITCLNQLNPKTIIYKLLTDKEEKEIKLKIADLEYKIRNLNHRLKINETVKQSGLTELTFKTC